MSWISFKGVRSDALGAVVSRMPSPARAARRVLRFEPPARHGTLHIFDGAYRAITLEAVLNLFGTASIDTVNAWLVGSGDLILSDDPTRCYRATIIDDIQYSRLKYGNDRYDQFTVRFECSPFRYEAEPVVLTFAEAGNIENTGNVPSEPIITVKGTGDGAIAVGGEAILLEGMNGMLIIDCEARQLAAESTGGKFTGKFPLLPLGSSPVAFSGGVTELIIRPNRRWL